MASSSSSSSSSPLRIHDVFVSFRGEDTRTLLSHLCGALTSIGVRVFEDDMMLKSGESFAKALLKSIENCRLSIVVVSRGYAFSRWCLHELVKIIERAKCGLLTVIPIFYDVDPSDVRKQSGIFANAFEEHQERAWDDLKTMQSWRKALTDVAGMKGYYSRNWRSDAELIEEIVGHVSTTLSVISKPIDDLVGIEASLKAMAPLFCMESTDKVQIIGIWGMGGVGKTTIARCLYSRYAHRFQYHRFIETVRARRMQNSQESFLPECYEERDLRSPTAEVRPYKVEARLGQPKVLLVLDDVHKLDQLDMLEEVRYRCGPGSVIIITTRYKDLLVEHGMNLIYEVRPLTSDDALQLFCYHAFGQKHPKGGFNHLSIQVVRLAAGLPLALKVLGSSLREKGKEEWENMLFKLRNEPNKDIIRVLRVSYDSLDEQHKTIFLHAACLFTGIYLEDFCKVMDACGSRTKTGVQLLIQRSLLEISSEGEIKMHHLLQDMGRQIVRGQSINEPGKLEFLMDVSNIRDVLMENTGSETLEGISLDLFGMDKKFVARNEIFERMSYLQFLRIEGYHAGKQRLEFPGGFNYLPHMLRFLRWSYNPWEALPSRFCPESLVVLNMPHSNLQKLWEGTQILTSLRTIRLKYAENLKELPDLSMAVNLEELDLSFCRRLVKVHSSVSILSKLTFLRLGGCRSLEYIPNIDSRCLELLMLDYCSSLRKLPQVSDSLQSLDLSGSTIEEVPPWVANLSRLVTLRMRNCKRLRNLPSSMENLFALEMLDIQYCEMLEDFPDTIQKLRFLKYFAVCNSPRITKFPLVPDSIEELVVRGTGIEEVPSRIENLSRLRCLNLSSNKNLKNIPIAIFKLASLEELDLSDCPNLESLPPETTETTVCLKTLDIRGTRINNLPPNLGQLACFLHLDAQKAPMEQEPLLYPEYPREKAFPFFTGKECGNHPLSTEGIEESCDDALTPSQNDYHSTEEPVSTVKLAVRSSEEAGERKQGLPSLSSEMTPEDQVDEHAGMAVAYDEISFKSSFRLPTEDGSQSSEEISCGIDLLFKEDLEECCDDAIKPFGSDSDSTDGESLTTEKSIVKNTQEAGAREQGFSTWEVVTLWISLNILLCGLLTSGMPGPSNPE